MKPQQIAVVSLHTCPWQQPGVADAGGMNVYVRQTALELAERGWTVDIFTRAHERAPTSIAGKSPGVRLIHAPAGALDTPKDELGSQLGPFVASALEFVRCEKLEYTLVMSHYWLSGLAAIQFAKAWQVPHFATFHTLSLIKRAAFPEEPSPAARVRGEREVIARADHLLATSAHERNELCETYGARPEAVSVASPGVDCARFAPRSQAGCRRALGLEESGRLILAVGRSAPIKGTEVLLHALARVEDPSVRLMLVGGSLGSPDLERIQELASELGIGERVQVMGSFPHELMPLCYGACDVCVVPSLYESFGLVALEAIACHRPVIASRVGGLQSVVSEGHDGLLVTPGSADELADALAVVLSDTRPVLRGDLVSLSRLRSWSATTDAILTALEAPG